MVITSTVTFGCSHGFAIAAPMMLIEEGISVASFAITKASFRHGVKSHFCILLLGTSTHQGLSLLCIGPAVLGSFMAIVDFNGFDGEGDQIVVQIADFEKRMLVVKRKVRVRPIGLAALLAFVADSLLLVLCQNKFVAESHFALNSLFYQ